MAKIRGERIPPCPRKVSTKALKHYMALNDMGNTHLAHCSGVPLNTINRIVSGDRQRPLVTTIDLIAETLGVPIENLLEFDL